MPYARASNRCAVRALQLWLQTAGIRRGPVFRRMRRGDTLTEQRLTDRSVALIVKRRALAAGLDPKPLSGHSLRAGYVTAAAASGIEERKIANVTRHTRTSPSYAATSDERPRSTTSARCCRHPNRPSIAHRR